MKKGLDEMLPLSSRAAMGWLDRPGTRSDGMPPSGRSPRFAAASPEPRQPATAPHRLPLALNRLFQAVPKTELHCHLSGSTPIGLIREFARENGLSDAQIRQTVRLKNRYRDLDDFLQVYYRVPAQVRTPEQYRRAAMAVVEEAGRENVRYLEVRSSVLIPGSTPRQIVDAIQAGLRAGAARVQQQRGYAMQVGLLVLAQRAGSPEKSLESARWAVQFAQEPGSMVRGFDLAGSESQHSVLKHAPALRYVKAHGLPLTVHAGETPTSEDLSGAQSIQAALALGADRIGHGVQLAQDPALMARMAKSQTPVELCPWSNVQLNAVPRYADHPLGTFLREGIHVSLNTDNRMMSRITLSRQLGQLYRHGLLTCWEQVKTLTQNGVRGAFISPLEKTHLSRQVADEFQRLEQRFRRVIDRYFCQQACEPAHGRSSRPVNRAS